MNLEPTKNTLPLTYASGAITFAPMAKTKPPVNIQKLLRAFQTRRATETGKPFFEYMMAEELGVPVKTLYHWLAKPGTQGARTPRGLSLQMLLIKLEQNGNGNPSSKA